MGHINTKHMKELRKRSGNLGSDDPLTSFLYTLMRDHLPTGVVEGIAMDSVYAPSTVFTNGWLALYAEDVANRLKEKKNESD